MACATWTACRVLLLVAGGVTLALAARGPGGAGNLQGGPNLQPTQNHIEFCGSLNNCSKWCSSCEDRIVPQLFDQLDNCPQFKGNANGYKYASRCSKDSYSVCVCTVNDVPCKKCEHSPENQLLCFSEQEGAVHVWDWQLSELRVPVELESMCPSCTCATNAPTTPKPPTTQPPIPTFHFGDRVGAKTVRTSVPPTTGIPPVQSNITIYAAVGGVVLLIVILTCVGCFCWRKKFKSKPKRNMGEQEYANIDEMMTLRNQASMMRSNQQLESNGVHLPRGHRDFNNEMYGLQVIGNGSTPPQKPPTLPSNHPPPSNPALPDAYQPLNLAQTRPSPGGASQPCPHCHHRPAPDRSATAPLLSSSGRPAQPLPASQSGSGRSPYMPLLKTNTCPAPATPQEEPVCRCHARPLSECSSLAESLPSGHSGARPGAPSKVDARPLSGGSDAQESPYYFKMEQPPQAPPSPPSPTPQYFKLEEAQTLPLETEMSPLLADPDSNGNRVLIKPVPKSQEPSATDPKVEPVGETKGPCEPCDVNVSSPSGSVKAPSRTVSPSPDAMDINPGGKHTLV